MSAHPNYVGMFFGGSPQDRAPSGRLLFTNESKCFLSASAKYINKTIYGKTADKNKRFINTIQYNTKVILLMKMFHSFQQGHVWYMHQNKQMGVLRKSIPRNSCRSVDGSGKNLIG